MTRIFRSHQAETDRIACEIANGAPTTDIFESVTPGGGKSALPGIIANRLIGPVIDRILWVAPRSALREQGEADFPEWSRFRIRSAGNEADPCRGTEGYITTYQAIVSDPERHLDTVSRGRWAVFLDEPHHVYQEGRWHQALAPILSRARLRVFASGTFSRGDGRAIAWVPYRPNGMPNFVQSPERAVVTYSRSTALREGAILPVRFSYLDGRAEWEDEAGAVRAAEISSGDYPAQALFTALRTDYAYALLDEQTDAWVRYKHDVFPAAKFLVVAHDIAQAQLYQAHLHRRRIEALIATSDDSPAAASAIARFKGQATPFCDVLVTVAMAYEGLSVPEITHIAALTHIRSVPWLEQMFARGNRTAPGKTEAFVCGPKDQRFLQAIRMIEAEQIEALKPQADTGGSGEGGEGAGQARPWITPIGSEAYRAANEAENIPGIFCKNDTEYSRPDGGMTPKAAEKLLRTQIADHIEIFLSRKRPGSKAAYSKILHAKLKELVGGKPREECSVDELTKQFAFLKENFPV